MLRSPQWLRLFARVRSDLHLAAVGFVSPVEVPAAHLLELHAAEPSRHRHYWKMQASVGAQRAQPDPKSLEQRLNLQQEQLPCHTQAATEGGELQRSRFCPLTTPEQTAQAGVSARQSNNASIPVCNAA